MTAEETLNILRQDEATAQVLEVVRDALSAPDGEYRAWRRFAYCLTGSSPEHLARIDHDKLDALRDLFTAFKKEPSA